MKKINLLDCTLRDGGYYNNWDFSTDLINDYLKITIKEFACKPTHSCFLSVSNTHNIYLYNFYKYIYEIYICHCCLYFFIILRKS